MGYKKIIMGIFISILALFVGCGVEFPYYQTSEFSDYNKVYKSNALYYCGFGRTNQSQCGTELVRTGVVYAVAGGENGVQS